LTRDPAHDRAWFDRWIAFDEREIALRSQDLQQPSGNADYRPQFMFDLAMVHLRTLLRRYGRGDPVDGLVQHLPPLIQQWEQAWELGRRTWSEAEFQARRRWSGHLDPYVRALWLVSLALLLDLDDGHWQRLVALVDNEDEDALLDRLIATRSPGRRIGTTLCHPRPYAGLLDAVTGAANAQPDRLARFVEGWYAGLDRPARAGLSPAASAQRVWWHGNDDTEGAYFGYWCVEAAAVAKAFGIDDGPCIGLPHYPAALLHPAAPPAAPLEPASVGWTSRLRQRWSAGRGG